MKKLVLVSLILLSLLQSACSNDNKQVNTNNANVKKEKEFVEASGTVKSKNIKNITIDFPSYVEKVNVEEGRKVKKNDILMTLNVEEFKVIIANKEQELKVAQITLQNLQDKMNRNKPGASKLQNDLKYAQDLYNKALQDYTGQEKLFSSGAISKRELDVEKNALDLKKKNVEDIKYALDDLQYNMLEDSKDIKIQNEKIISLGNELKSSREKLNRVYMQENNIISELQNGVVYEIGYKPGDIVSSSKKALSIMDLDSIIISAKVAEEFIKDVKAGAEVVIHPLFDSAKTYTGKVEKIADMAILENGQTFVTVEINIGNKDDFLLPNFNVEIEIKR